MRDFIMLSVPVILAAICAMIGALFLELRDHRDRLTRLEVRLDEVLARDRRTYNGTRPYA